MIMKNLKKFIFTLSLSAFAVFANAEVLTVDAGKTVNLTEDVYVNSDYGDYSSVIVNGTLNWNPSDPVYAEFGIDGTAVNASSPATITVNGGTFNANGGVILGGGVFKVSNGGTFDNSGYIFEMGSLGYSYFNVTGEGSTATFGDITTMGGAKSNIIIDNNATLYANDIALHANPDKSAVLSMNQHGKLNANRIIAEANAFVQIDAATINVNDINIAGQSKTEKAKLELGTGATLNINQGSNSFLTGTTITAGATLNINAGKVQTYGSEAFALNGGTLNVANGASLVVANAKLADESSGYTFVVGGGTASAPTKINLKGNAHIILSDSQGGNDIRVGIYGGGYAVSEIKAGRQGAIVADKLTFVNTTNGKDSTLTLNSKNIFVGSKAYDTNAGEYVNGYADNAANYNTTVVLGSNVQAEIVVNADAMFGEVSYQKDCELVLTLGNTGVISFKQFAEGYAFNKASYAKLTINEFENNRIFIQNMATVGDLVDLPVTNEYHNPNLPTVQITATLSKDLADLYDQKTYTNEDFAMVLGEYNGMEGYWLNITAVVPEPAEWAAIFGAIALGFAMYRRRK